MDRLTDKESRNVNPAGEGGLCVSAEFVRRLAAYEDSGITPELAAMYAKYHNNRGSMISELDELWKFRKAQREGRIAIIPQAPKGLRPLVTDTPDSNEEKILNLFYIKGHEVWVRGGGPGPSFPDITLYEYVRQIAKEHNLAIDVEMSDDDLSDCMYEMLFDGYETVEGIVATLYTAAWAFVELRERLKLFEATGSDPTKLLERRESPFSNDPFSVVWAAFKNLYPDKTCKVYWDQHQKDEHSEEYGFTNFPDDGGTPRVFIYAEHPVNTQAETLGHELAHVAVGLEHGHDQAWEEAFEAIFQEYNRLGSLLFGDAPPKDNAEA